MTVGNTLALLLEVRGLRQTDVRGFLADEGVHVTAATVSRWCSGDRAPDPRRAAILARVLRVPLKFVQGRATVLEVLDFLRAEAARKEQRERAA